MKKFLLIMLLGLVLVSVASAELLTTANPLGKGKWAGLGAYISDANVQNNSSYNMTTIGGYVGYGVTDKLDAYLQYGAATVGGLPTVNGAYLAAAYGNPALAALPGSVQAKSSITAIGLNAKYTLIEEGNGLPFSLAAGAGYKSLNYSMTTPGLDSLTAPTKIIGTDATATGNQSMVGFGISKMMIPFIPYAGVDYRSTTQSGNAVSTQVDLTLGTLIGLSMHGGILVEYTQQSVTPNGGSNYSSGQVSGAVAYIL